MRANAICCHMLGIRHIFTRPYHPDLTECSSSATTRWSSSTSGPVARSPKASAKAR